MTRQILIPIICMHECPLNTRHALKHILQALAQIMRVPETHLLVVEDDVDFHVESVTGVVGLEALDGFDGFRESHGEVKEDVAFVGGGGGAGEVADMGGGGEGPLEDDVEGEDEAAEGVEGPEVEVEA